MDSNAPNPACPLTEAQIAHAADLALGVSPAQPVPQSPALTRLSAMLDSLGQPALEPVPEPLLTRLVRIGSRAPSAKLLDRAADAMAAGIMGAARSILATLTFDSRVSPALSGFRGTASAIQLGFTSEAGDVHLQISEPEAPGTLITVRGAFEPTNAPGGVVEGAGGRFELTAVDGQGADARGDLDDDLMFALRIAPGTYRARLWRGSEAIDLGEIEVP